MSIAFSPISRRLFMGAGAVAAGITVAGCGFDETESPSGGGDGESGGPSGLLRAVMNTGDGISSIDPHYVNDSMIVVPGTLLEGLVLANDTGTDVVAGAAESWELSEDGLTYTFAMRKGATWSNGDSITANDAVTTYQRLLAPTGAGTNYAGGASSYLTGLGIKGAAEHLSGASDDWGAVGISAPDEQTLMIELEAPNADFLLSMSHYSMVLLHPPSIEGDTLDWMQPENFVGNAAYVPSRWDPTTTFRMAANENYWDAANVGIGEVELLQGMDLTAALASFDSGDIHLTIVEPSIVSEREDLQGSVQSVDGNTCVYLQKMWGGSELGNDVKVRQALSMGTDREALAEVEGTAAAGTSLIPGNVVPGWDESIAMNFDPDAARALMDDALGGAPVPPLRVQFSYPTPWLQVLQSNWSEVFETDVAIDVLEGGVHVDTRWKPFEDTSVISFYGGTFGGMSTMNNWIINIFGPDFTRQFSLSTDDWAEFQAIQADEGMDGDAKAEAVESFLRDNAHPDAVAFAEQSLAASRIVDNAERTTKFLEAAKIREDLALSIPLIWLAKNLLVSDTVSDLSFRASPEFTYYKDGTLSE